MGATLAHVRLAAEDWFEALDFYHELLGLPIVARDELAGCARLQAGPGLVLEIVSGGWGVEGPKSARENPVTLCLRVERLDRLAAELEARGAAFLSEPERGAAALMDPEGNRLLLYDTPEPPAHAPPWEE